MIGVGVALIEVLENIRQEHNLNEQYKQQTAIQEMEPMAGLWDAYRTNDLARLQHTATKLEKKYPFILDAVRAHIERLPSAEDPGRPMRTLKAIVEELGTEEFGSVFQEFCNREPIYGFGDLQVKRMLNDLISKGG